MADRLRPAPPPPWTARALLRLSVPRRQYEFIAGDLEEGYRDLFEREGVRRARDWYRRQVRAARGLAGPTRADVVAGWKGQPMIAGLGADVRAAVQSLRRTPLFTLVAVVMLALGIGANTTTFSWVNAVLITPLPGTHEPGDLVHFASFLHGAPDTGFLYPDYRDLRSLTSVTGLAAHSARATTLTFEGQPRRAWCELVTDNFFAVIGTPPALGRTFVAADVRGPEDAPVVVISDALWHSRFGGAQSVIGQLLPLNGHAATIVGVTPPAFQGGQAGLAMDFWMPITQHALVMPGKDRLTQPGWGWMELLGRLRPGVSPARAGAEFDTAFKRLVTARGAKDYEGAVAFRLRDAAGGSIGLLRPVLLVLSAVSALVLLITCANLANLLLTRAASRRRELAIRSSLGAGRMALVRQLLVESLLLAAAGTVGALAVAHWFGDLLTAFAPPSDLPVALHATLDWRVLLFAVACTVLTTLLFGTAPALVAASGDLVAALKDGMPTVTGRGRTRAALVVAQVMLAILLLVPAGLLVRSLAQARAFDPGFDPSGVLLASVDLYPRASTPDRAREVYRLLLAKVGAAPGVTSVTLGDNVPLGFDGGAWTTATVDGYPAAPNERVGGGYNLVGPDYFRTLRTPVLRGRDFTMADDDHGERVVIINKAMAARYWNGRDALGGRVRFWDDQWMRVVGIVADSRQETVNEAPAPFFWVPLLQFPSSQLSLHVRTAGDPVSMVGVVREAVRAVDPGLPIYNIRTLAEHTKAATFRQRLAGTLLSVVAGLALALAMIGLYAVLSYMVAQRTREIGVRLALGATAGDLVRLMGREALGLLGPGVVLGVAAALLLVHFLTSLLIGIGPRDPVTFAGAVVVVSIASAAAWLLPTRRAMRVNPLTALRQD